MRTEFTHAYKHAFIVTLQLFPNTPLLASVTYLTPNSHAHSLSFSTFQLLSSYAAIYSFPFIYVAHKYSNYCHIYVGMCFTCKLHSSLNFRRRIYSLHYFYAFIFIYSYVYFFLNAQQTIQK